MAPFAAGAVSGASANVWVSLAYSFFDRPESISGRPRTTSVSYASGATVRFIPSPPADASGQLQSRKVSCGSFACVLPDRGGQFEMGPMHVVAHCLQVGSKSLHLDVVGPGLDDRSAVPLGERDEARRVAVIP